MLYEYEYRLTTRVDKCINHSMFADDVQLCVEVLTKVLGYAPVIYALCQPCFIKELTILRSPEWKDTSRVEAAEKIADQAIKSDSLDMTVGEIRQLLHG